MITKRMPQSSANAYRRGVRPAGRSSRRMPSGVSAATTVSRMSRESRPASRLHDDGVGNLVVQALPRIPEDEQDLHDAVERPDQRNRRDQAVDDVAQPEDAVERHRRAVAANHLDAQNLLGDRLTVLLDVLDRQPEPDDRTGQRRHERDGDHGARVAAGSRRRERARDEKPEQQWSGAHRAGDQAVEQHGAEPGSAVSGYDPDDIDDIGDRGPRRCIWIGHSLERLLKSALIRSPAPGVAFGLLAGLVLVSAGSQREINGREDLSSRRKVQPQDSGGWCGSDGVTTAP